MTIEARLTFATQLILDAGQLAARHFAHREDLTRETKGPQDFVSIADRPNFARLSGQTLLRRDRKISSILGAT